ncbi:MAG: mechanosensitive ion channel family protein [Thermomicrobiales bacterium]|nr:mechanosensitive ion channel family protein [Thermomicrobiales bacterium]
MLNETAETVLRALLVAGTVILAAYLGFAVLYWLARRFDHRRPGLANLMDRAKQPVRFIVGIIAARIVTSRIAHLRKGWIDVLDHVLQILMIVAIAWLVISAVKGVEDKVIQAYRKRDYGPIEERRFETQVSLVRRLVIACLAGLAVVAILMTFPSVRAIGASLLASAGLISIIAGLAAQTSLTNVFAGIQLTLSDTIRVDDVVVVNGQSGTVAQLALTHVEVRLWDGRMLILPSSFFISQPFENWTRNRNQIGGSVFLDVDWSTPIADLRQEAQRIIAESELWDGRRNSVRVSEVIGNTRRIQIGVSAANTNDLFSLQALVLEELTEYLYANHPESVVRTRMQAFDPADATKSPPT